MVQFGVFAKRISRLPAVPSPSRIPIPPPLSPNSHRINLFADPHPLNSAVSYRYGITGGRATVSLRPFNFQLSTVNLFPPNSFEILPSEEITSSRALRPRKFFSCNTYGSPASVANKRLTAQLSPLAATLTKNRGWGCSEHSNLQTLKRSVSSVAIFLP
jgi:hypothetical protein